MMKILPADKVKKLPPGTDVYLVNEKDESLKGRLWIVKVGRKKMLKAVVAGTLFEIEDRDGWFYEVEK